MSVPAVTGASRGIGAAICRKAAEGGYACHVNCTSNADGAASVVSDITRSGGRAIAVRADVADPAQVEAKYAGVHRDLGTVTGLVNTACVMGSTGRVEELDAAPTRRLFEVNALTPFLCSGAALRSMSVRCGGAGGSIVNISSTAAKHRGAGSHVDHAASKGALDTFAVGLPRKGATGPACV